MCGEAYDWYTHPPLFFHVYIPQPLLATPTTPPQPPHTFPPPTPTHHRHRHTRGVLTTASKSMELLCTSLTDLRRTWHALAATLPLGVSRASSVQGGSPSGGLSRSSSVNSLDSFRLEVEPVQARGVPPRERCVCSRGCGLGELGGEEAGLGGGGCVCN